MEIIEIMQKINVDKIPLEVQKVTSQQINGEGFLLSFVVANNEEIKTYEVCTEEQKKEYVSQSSRIILPELTVKQYVELFKDDQTGSYSRAINLIREIIERNNVDEEIGFCIYTLLHEVGHWHHFSQMNNKVYDYYILDGEIRKQVFEEMIGIRRILELNKNKMNHSIRRKLKNNAIRYREIPMEKRADQYAYDNLEEALIMYSADIQGNTAKQN